ncbi:hypothetical protein [Shinella sp. NM-101]|uniref:hypothetical protein n=1 Tax=Shinella sp. NM-101 TaxID=2744455 RepID=UPI001F489D72|nr:hypothetical protein [Shinella sp. NM-101]
MKIAELKAELLLLVIAVLPIVSFVLRYTAERDVVQVIEAAFVDGYHVDALLKAEGRSGIVSVWIEQGGVRMCDTVAHLPRGEPRKVTVLCPELTPEPFKVGVRAQ